MECPYCHAEIADQAARCPICENELGATSDPAWLDRVANVVLNWMSSNEAEVRAWVDAQRASAPAASPEEIARKAISSAKLWTGGVGFVAGLGDFLGPLGFGAGTVTDIYYSAKLSVQMGQRIFCAYGHDISSDEVRVRIMAALGGGTAAAGKVAGEGSARVAKRLIEKYLRGALLKAIKAFLRKLGIIFTRKALLAALPLLGSGVNAVVNRALMGQLGNALLQDVRGEASG
jgi:hypothetical protein